MQKCSAAVWYLYLQIDILSASGWEYKLQMQLQLASFS
jgi:hypothetical protein